MIPLVPPWRGDLSRHAKSPIRFDAMKASPTTRRTLVLCSLIAGCAAEGCARTDPAVKRSRAAIDTLADTRGSMVQAEQTVADSQLALRAVKDGKGDLTPAFEAFVAQINAVRKQADRVRREGEVVKERTEEYCIGRANDVSTITNTEMRKLAQQRATHVRQECDAINAGYGRVNGAFVQYLTGLTDLQRYLANELNYSAVRSGEKWCVDALAAGERLRGDIRALALKIELTSNLLSPSPTAVTRWPSTLNVATTQATQPTTTTRP